MFANERKTNLVNKIVLASLSGILLSFGFPPVHQLVFLALGLLVFYAAVVWKPKSRSFSVGFFFGATFYLFHLFWFYNFHPLILLFVVLLAGLFFGLTLYLTEKLFQLTPLTLTLYWFTSQWLIGRGSIPFPWSRFSTALAKYSAAVQPVRFTGELIWGSIVVFSIFGLASLFFSSEHIFGRKKEFLCGAIIVLLGLIWGYWRVESTQPLVSETRVLLVQPNFAFEGPRDSTQEEIKDQLLLQLVNQSKSSYENEDLVVWPETSLMHFPVTLKGDKAHFRSSSWRNYLRDLDFGGALLFGTVIQDPKKNRLKQLNSAVMLDSEKTISGYYTKKRPVFLGEYLPYAGTSSYVKTIAQYFGTLGYRAGVKESPMKFGTNNSWKISTNICFEESLPNFINKETHRKNAGLIVNLTNDGWAKSHAMQKQHLLRSKLRAIETGRTVLRSTQTGISAVINPLGQVVNSIGSFQQGTLKESIRTPLSFSLYTRHRYKLEWAFLVFMLLASYRVSKVKFLDE